MTDKFFDFDDTPDTQLPALHEQEDMDESLILCDTCNVKLYPFQKGFICPACLQQYNPHLEHIKHERVESTLDEDADINSGEISFVEDDNIKQSKTRIRTKIEERDVPLYVKKEFEHITTISGHKAVKIDKKLFGSG